MRGNTVVLLAAVTIAAAGCKKSEPAGQQPAGAPSAEAGAPSSRLEGTLLEKIDAPPYTYLKLKTAAGETWAAVPKIDAAVGSKVTVVDAMPMEKFESKTLKRTFDVVYFGNVPGPGAA
ncbi:MAG: nucleotide-binding protein, partial [Anaeromyxobacteraceae bacterium]